MIKKITLSALLALSTLFSVSVSATPIYGTFVEADGSFSGNINSVLGAPDDQFIQIDNNTSVTVSFGENQAALADGTDAADLIIHTYDLPYPADARVEYSADNLNFFLLGIFSDANLNNVINIDFDLLGIDQVTTLRITDISGEAAGFDLDAIEGVNAGDVLSVPEPSSLILLALALLAICFLQKPRSQQV
ncbi:PEP-CTERM sorting domain-containing protein [Thalassomonas viridans]|uniref:PEP-CTERM sorting domain-containing protein n=1 Tax=Thalassomonas viridans TaxID=137584 RepID=A0AAE9Z358_9GAMM|nr:PEP-CTERM sorting domain-containing protein [Thalassomonas viridans]WDE05886.1 PEP-CTERM sorting domain-containing protein [Thalassomonas viridans]